MISFESIFGQASAVSSLRRVIAANNLPGAYLFVGAPGVGKGAVARATAKAAACLNLSSDPTDSCGACESCRRVEMGTNPDIITFLPAADQTQIHQFWERENKPNSGALSRTLNYAPIIGKRKVYIVERAETLTESAANSLLKVLEEPPPYALFILMAPHPGRVLPTIVSRSQMVRLSASSRNGLENYLVESHKVDSAHASLYAALSEGRTGQALRMAQTPKLYGEIAKILDFAETIPAATQLQALQISEQMRKLSTSIKALISEESTVEAGRDDAEMEGATAKEKGSRKQLAAVFELLVVFYRDVFAVTVGGGAEQAVMARERLGAISLASRSGDLQRWTYCLDSLMLARRRLEANASIAMVTDVLAMCLVA